MSISTYSSFYSPIFRAAFILLLSGFYAQTAQAQMDLGACQRKLRPGAEANGVSLADFSRYTQNATLLAATVASAKKQPEGTETWWDYVAKTVDDERVVHGQDVVARTKESLAAIGQRYDVDGEVLVAIFGIETNYGVQLGKVDVLNAWLTRACTESNPLWAKNAYASIRLLRDAVVDPSAFTGSWSGAFGMTQFIPTSFYELAVDGDGDGHIDLYRSLPDALASSANHLRKRGAQWTRGLSPLIEVVLPGKMLAGLPDDPFTEVWQRGERRSLAHWAAAGVKRVGGKPLVQPLAGGNWVKAPAYLFAPAGGRGPVFLATSNFDAILHYNQSRRYGLAVSLLTDSLKGGPPLKTSWPTDDPGLSRVEIRSLQQLLLERGHAVGVPDGIPGLLTRQAIQAEQGRLGWMQDGRAGRRVLQALEEDRAASGK